jgi:hypothetical protein
MRVFVLVLAGALVVCTGTAWADPQPAGRAAPFRAGEPYPPDDAAMDEAQELLSRADLLDELASGADDAAAAAERNAEARDREARRLREAKKGYAKATQRASALEAEAVVTRALARRQRDRAKENRELANQMRARAMRIAKGEEPAESPNDECDPPFRFDAQGRKHYVVACL